MAITRTAITDDSGSGTDGTVLNNAWKTELYDQIDAFALPLAGGTLTGALTTNGQVAFPATQNASANANTLDDYEEGTWTPNVGGTATYTTQVGTYTKIGRQVTVHGRMKINAIGTGSTNAIVGLPFLSIAQEQAGSVGFLSGAVGNVVSIYCTVLASNAAIQLYSLAAAGATTTGAAIFTAANEIIVSATYFTT
jgi:hypothetical protein